MPKVKCRWCGLPAEYTCDWSPLDQVGWGVRFCKAAFCAKHRYHAGDVDCRRIMPQSHHAVLSVNYCPDHSPKPASAKAVPA